MVVPETTSGKRSGGPRAALPLIAIRQIININTVPLSCIDCFGVLVIASTGNDAAAVAVLETSQPCAAKRW